MGIPTAAHLWEFAHAAVPGVKWASVAESDHVHLQMASTNAIGLNTPTGTKLWEIPTGREITVQSLALKNHGFGDIEMGDTDMGDFDESEGDFTLDDNDEDTDFEDNMEEGSPLMQLKKSPLQLLSKLKRRNPAARKIFKVLPQKKKLAIRGLAAHQKARLMQSTFYEQISAGGVIRSSTIGTSRRMGPSEVEAFRANLYRLPYFDPAVTSFTYNAGPGTYTLDVNTALAAASGLAAGPAEFGGGVIVMAASALNLIPEQAITLVRSLTGSTPRAQTNTTLMTLARTFISTRFFFINASIVAGRTRLTQPVLSNLAVAGVNTLTISGLPANYTVQLSFVQPGDALIDNYIRHMA
jgi:hypothetical protein